MNTESTTPQAATTAHRYAVVFRPQPRHPGLAGRQPLARALCGTTGPLPQLDIHGVAPPTCSA